MYLRPALLAAILSMIVSFALGQNRPFPQHTPYQAGSILPSSVGRNALDDSTVAFYDRWKARYIRTGCDSGQSYIYFENGDSVLCVSEGQGYGMMITALMAGYDPNAQALFDNLYRWYKAHPSEINPGLMAWRQVTGCRSSFDANSATDGDIDIAFALLLANEQWGSAGSVNYLYEAVTTINAVLQDEINPVTHSVKLGDWSGPDSPALYFGTRTSDFVMDHFRAFQQVTGDTNWSAVITRCYSLVDAIQTSYSPATGLLPDFISGINVSPSPAPPFFLEGSTDGYYNYNACRDPWRLATDYLVYGDTRAKVAVEKINSWIKGVTGGDAALVRSGFKLNGTNITGNNYSDAAFTAPLMVGAMVNSSNQAWLNSLWSVVTSYNFAADGYYQNTLKMLSMIVASGNWWSPANSRTVDFSGFAWDVKASPGKVGPGPNYFSDSLSSVRVDSAGRLHMGIRYANGKWYCSEVILTKALGYGRYVFHLGSPAGTLDPNAVLGLFTWDDAAPENHREIDVEYSRWGDSTDITNGQFVVQPYSHSGNLVRWTLPATAQISTTEFDWRQDSVTFRTAKGDAAFPPHDSIFAQWKYAGTDIPHPGDERVHINAWLMSGHVPMDGKATEIIISKFEFNPLPPAAGTPSLIAPPDHATLNSYPISFVWDHSEGADVYHLQIAPDTSFTSLIVNDSTIHDTVSLQSFLPNRQALYWRVRARTAEGGIGQWTGYRTFMYVGVNQWRLISPALRYADPRLTVLYPGALSALYSYADPGGYIENSILEPGRGYWLKSDSAGIPAASGDSIFADTISVTSGWNLIGALSIPLSVDSISSSPPGMAVSGFFGFENGYVNAGYLNPGKGYWVKTDFSGVLILSAHEALVPAGRIRIIPVSQRTIMRKLHAPGK